MDFSQVFMWGKTHDIVVAVLLTVLSLTFPVSIVLRCSLWAVVWLLLLHLGFVTWRTEPLVKAIFEIGLTACVVALAWVPVREAWKREEAAALSGYLVVANRSGPHPTALLEIGDSNTTFLYVGPPNQPFMQILYDAGLRIEVRENRIEISTPVRDRFGHVVATIDRNRWSVSPDRAVCWDKNYTHDALEVLDGGGHVIFQMRVLPDRVRLQGEWRDQYGNGVRIMKSPDPNRPGAIMTVWHDPQAEQQLQQLIPPMFKYPSSDHWGELVGEPGPNR
jgi:hypothetical protein